MSIGTFSFAQKIGIGTNAPTERLHLLGNFRLEGAFMPGNSAGTAGQVLQSNGPNSAPTWVTPSGGGNMSGRRNYLARYISSTTLRDGQVQDDSVQVNINRVPSLPSADLNDYFTITAPGSGVGVLNNQRIGIHAMTTDSTALYGEANGAAGTTSAIVGKVKGGIRGPALRGMSLCNIPSATSMGVHGSAAMAADGLTGNYAWGVLGEMGAANDYRITRGPVGNGILRPCGVMGWAGTRGHGYGVQAITFSDSILSAGVYGLNNPLSPTQQVFQSGVLGETSNQMYGVIGLSSFVTQNGNIQQGSGIGISGRTLAGSIGGTGVEGFAIEVPGLTTEVATVGTFGRSSSSKDDAIGVYGLGLSSVGTGLRNYGVYGESFGVADSASGVKGESFSANGYGIYGTNVKGIGVFGIHYDTTGISAGIEGTSLSNAADGVGILGYSSSTVNTAQHYGVFGRIFDSNVNSAGIKGDDEEDGPTCGLALAGLFNGRVKVTCDLEIGAKISGVELNISGTKNFRIDHPNDPANRYLVHSCVESNEVLNVYSGSATTSGLENEVVVTLPEYFQSLNKDFRYQLTCINQFANAIVSKEISYNQFTIKTDKPNVKVSWVVYAVRNDKYMQDHPFQAEQFKEPENQGKYLYPAGYNQPETAKIGYSAVPSVKFNPKKASSTKSSGSSTGLRAYREKHIKDMDKFIKDMQRLRNEANDPSKQVKFNGAVVPEHTTSKPTPLRN